MGSEAPGHEVTIGERTAAQVAAQSSGNGFIVGFTERGPSDAPILVTSLADAVSKLGERLTGTPVVYDFLDVAFREGATSIYVGRIVGPGAATAEGELLDGGTDPTLKVLASSPGEWGNDIDVDVVLSGESFVITVKYDGTVVETSPSLADNTEAVAWAQANSSYIVLEDLSTEYEPTGDPATQSESLEGGDGDVANATDTELEAALALFGRDLGPGQVAAPGFTTSTVHEALLEHARLNNRRALLDLVDSGNENTLAAAATALRSVPGKAARFGAAFAPWCIAPGLSLGTTRTVPRSALQMGLIARADAETGDPGIAAAGKRGRARYVTGLTQTFTDAQRKTLNDAGVNAAILIRGVPTNYGNRTLTNPLTDGDWKAFSASRVVMAVAAAADIVLEDYDFSKIDGRGNTFAKLAGDLKGRACMPFYLADSLYGTTPDEAFAVNTGPEVNTPATIEAEEIHAQIAVKVSPTGERLTTEVVKVPIAEALV